MQHCNIKRWFIHSSSLVISETAFSCAGNSTIYLLLIQLRSTHTLQSDRAFFQLQGDNVNRKTTPNPRTEFSSCSMSFANSTLTAIPPHLPGEIFSFSHNKARISSNIYYTRPSSEYKSSGRVLLVVHPLMTIIYTLQTSTGTLQYHIHLCPAVAARATPVYIFSIWDTNAGYAKNQQRCAAQQIKPRYCHNLPYSKLVEPRAPDYSIVKKGGNFYHRDVHTHTYTPGCCNFECKPSIFSQFSPCATYKLVLKT